jgi:multidrug efflux pump subunit AcrA (membrane-fusion protein)
MLNISNNKLNTKVDLSTYKSVQKVFHKKHFKYFNRFLKAFAVVVLVVMFLPWTQNINSRGSVTTLTPDQRPQTIQSRIPGRIESWHVKEGDYVKKGDTILFISEVKNEYFDPNLVNRTGQQIKAKEASVSSYGFKVNALNNQIGALTRERKLKLKQAENKLLQAGYKVQSDSIELEAVKIDLGIAERQIGAIQNLYDEDLKSLTELEEKRSKFQEKQAELISQHNKYLASQNEVLNSKIELNRIDQEYIDKISKAESDKFTAESSGFDAEVQVTKLESDFTSYKMRNDMYYITAPQNGYINKAIIGGIGETFKEGQSLVGIMPSDYDLAVETFVNPIDLPLIHLNEKVRVQFDGWPAIIFSGWPNVSYGTYGAKVVAIENFISDNGKFRILLAPDETDHEWPEAIRVGSGAKTIALLEDVPIWFELWRNLNGFPPDYYQPKGAPKNKKDK